MRSDEQGHHDHCRVEFTPVHDEVKDVVKYMKLATNKFIHELGQLMQGQDGEVARLFATSRSKYEDACMWAVKGLTSEAFRHTSVPEPTDQSGAQSAKR